MDETGTNQIGERLHSSIGDAVELMFGLVGPTGVDLGKVCEALTDRLNASGYRVEVVRVSDLLAVALGEPDVSSFAEHERLDRLMTYGTQLRQKAGQAEVAARLAIAKIRQLRESITGDGNRPASRTAYVIRSLKRDEEASLLREVYGDAFTLISVYATREERHTHLRNRFGSAARSAGTTADEVAAKLISRDYHEEGSSLGQAVGKIFPLADFFLRDGSWSSLTVQLDRLVKLVFGDPYVSPKRDEQAMFFAQAAALRSLDLSRQVGAAIVSQDGDILATGCNEVPSAGGGLYWEDQDEPLRDYELGRDANVESRIDLVDDAVRRLRESGWLEPSLTDLPDRELTEKALFGESAPLRAARLLDVIEFGRAVHAEMAAISQAARLGVRLQGARMFCTTFPCHLCARHIVAAGVRDVTFIEPYEKSRTGALYSDSISIESKEASTSRVNFRAFVGVAPRRYLAWFRMERPRKTPDGKVVPLRLQPVAPRVRFFVLAYLSGEVRAVQDLATRLPAFTGERPS